MTAGLIRRLRRDCRGTLSVEVAIAIPILLMLVLTGIEVTRYVLLNQKIERTAVTMSDLVSQADVLTEASLEDLFLATGFVMAPFELGSRGQIVVSTIVTEGAATPTIAWQRSYGGAAGGSAFGVEGGSATLPVGFVVRAGESVVVTEAFYDFEPAFFDTLLDPRTLYSFAMFRPRFSALDNIQP